ncbi:MAG: FAD-dependent oxidoreductase [bacterium]
MRIGIIGGGHAGTEAAKAARQAGADTVVLYSGEAVPPYSRPRLVALAFQQAAVDELWLKPTAWYAAAGIELRLATPVTGVRPATGEIEAAGGWETYDTVVLACGAVPIRPGVAGAAGAWWPLWSYDQALAIRNGFRAGDALLVLGGGILGVEAALRAAAAGMKPMLVEKCPGLMPAQFAPAAGAVLRTVLEQRGVTVRTGVSLTAAAPAQAAGQWRYLLDDGSAVEARGAMLSIGARPALELARRAELPVASGVVVTDTLLAGGRVFAAGDITQLAGGTRCSVREALGQGKVAGINAVAAAAGQPLQRYHYQPAPLQFAFNEMVLCSAGDPGVAAEAEVETLPAPPAAYRALVRRATRLAGVQMIGTKQEFDQYVRQLAAT